MVLDYKSGKDLLLGFYYGPLFSRTIDKIHYVCKSDISQIRFTNKLLGGILKGELNPNQAETSLKDSQLFNASQITIILSILTTDIFDSLKEALDAVYNNNPTNSTTSEPALSKQEQVKTAPEMLQKSVPVTQPIENTSDPLDIFDRAKKDLGTQIEPPNIQTNAPDMSSNIQTAPAAPVSQKVESISNIRTNKAAILEDSSATNLKFQDNQSVERLSDLLKAKAEAPNQEDLNLYVPTPEEKIDDLKPLNPIETGNDIDGLKESAQEEMIPPVVLPAALINSNTTEPKNSTMAENIARSRLKFAQNEQRGIVAEKSYSKLLGAMNQKPKNQPDIVGKLKETFEHPERYTVPQEPSKPKPKKYSFTDGANNISVTSSQEKSSNAPANAIMQEEVEDDIINLAKNISQKTSAPIPVEAPQGPIVYTKQSQKTNDPFANITPDKKDSSANKNPNVIDLSGG